MGLGKNLKKALLEINSLQKKEDPKAYADRANTGLLLGHPVKIKGQEHRPDNGVKYHATIKFFDKEGEKPDDVHKVASGLKLHPPNPKETYIEPKVIKDRNGNDVYTVGLHGKHADKLKEHHEKFSHMGHKENYKWGAHISVPKEIHDEIKNKGHKTAHEAGIEFGPAQLRHGKEVVHTYHSKEEKLAASEKSNLEPLMKPYKSDAQRRWAHTAAGKEALGGEAAVHEWDEATKGKKLPERVAKSEKESIKNKLNVEKGDKDISEKSLSQIQEDTAWTWASRAAACYEKLAKTGDWKWKTDAEEYRHEAVEHAALIGDTHPHVLEEIQKSLQKYRKESQENAEELNKTEELEKGWKEKAIGATMAGVSALASHPAKAQLQDPSSKLFHQSNPKISQTMSIKPNKTKEGEFPSKLGIHKPKTGQVTESLNYDKKGNFVPAKSNGGQSFNERQFGPYKVSTMIEGYGGAASGSNLQHTIELPKGLNPDPKMAVRVAKEIGVHPSYIHNIKSGSSYIYGNNKIGENANVPSYETPEGYKRVGKTEELEKGTLKNILTAGAMAGALASPNVGNPSTPTPHENRALASISKPKESLNRQKFLNALGQIESSGGKNTKHKPTSQGQAYGRWAIMPSVIYDTIRLNPDIKQKHQKALKLQGQDLAHYMQDNPKLEEEIVNRHLDRLEHHFGNDPEKLAFGWNQGITNTNKALKQKQNIAHHPYVQKFKQAYSKGM